MSPVGFGSQQRDRHLSNPQSSYCRLTGHVCQTPNIAQPGFLHFFDTNPKKNGRKKINAIMIEFLHEYRSPLG
jgi:hypothetical protein